MQSQSTSSLSISARTKLCGVFGHPVAHSLSPLIHNYGYATLGLDYAYLAFDVPEIGPAVAAVRTLGMTGASITVPHKVAVMEHLDSIDPFAARIGACNTVVNRRGRLTGYNTDWYGALAPLRKRFGRRLAGKQVVLLGAGGTGRAIAFGLAKERLTFVVLNRTAAKAKRLAAETGAAGYGRLADFPRYADWDIVINATSVGLSGRSAKAVPIDSALLGPGQTVFDIVYGAKPTPLLRAAARRGATVIPGREMLLHQAELQFKLFTSRKLPTRELGRVLAKG